MKKSCQSVSPDIGPLSQKLIPMSVKSYMVPPPQHLSHTHDLQSHLLLWHQISLWVGKPTPPKASAKPQNTLCSQFSSHILPSTSGSLLYNINKPTAIILSFLTQINLNNLGFNCET